MTTSNSIRKNDDLREHLGQFATSATRLAGLEARGAITPEQAARKIGELYFQLSLNAARNASTH